MSNVLFNESWTVADFITPQSLHNGATYSAYLPVAGINRFVGLFGLGVGDDTMDLKVTSYSDGSGTNPVDVTGAALVQISATGDNKCHTLEVDTRSVGDGQTHLRFAVTAGSAGSGFLSTLFVLADPVYKPGTSSAKLVQTVAV